MKEEALKLADEIDNFLKEEEQLPWGTKQVYLDMASTMIRRLVEELEQTKRKYKNMHNLATQAMSRVHQLEKERSE